jgi:hypothetical protein
MNQAQAIAKLTKALGPKFGWRVNRKALDEAGRGQQRLLARELSGKRKQAEEAMNARVKELLQDPAYQALKAEYDDLSKQRDAAVGRALHAPITVGLLESGWFSVKAEGDNWSDVVEKLIPAKSPA